MQTVLLVLHVLMAIALIALILVQHGRGADAGAAFGAGASGTVFGARGSANFLSRTTAVLAALFFANSLALAWLSGQAAHRKTLMERVSEVPAAVQPAAAPESAAPAGGDDTPPVPGKAPDDTPPVPGQAPDDAPPVPAG